MIKIYHNNRCRKSRGALALIQESGQPYEVVEYLKYTPSVAELKELLLKLNLKPQELVRKGEKLYKDTFAGKPYADEEWLKILAENPILIERPIVVKNEKAVIGRPPEKVLTIL